MKYDVAVIGGGPAGLSAAINLKILNKKVAVFAAEKASKKLISAPLILNYLGIPQIKGSILSELFDNHTKSMDVEIIPAKVKAVYPTDGGFLLDMGDKFLDAVAVILATGASSIPSIKNEDKFLGNGVSYCATCDAPLIKNKRACIVGYDEHSVQEANFVSEICDKVIFMPMGKFSAKLNEKIEVIFDKPIEFLGDSKAETLKCIKQEIKADGFFVLKQLSADKIVNGLEIKEGAVKVNRDLSTNIKGIFAAGDITGKPFKYQKSAGEGLTAAFSAADYVDNLKKESQKETKTETAKAKKSSKSKDKKAE